MICDKCKEAGIKSGKVYVGYTSETMVGSQRYFDGDGKEHEHNPNCMITSYSCDQGHSFSVRTVHSCWCGWKGKEECFCHPAGQRHYEKAVKVNRVIEE